MASLPKKGIKGTNFKAWAVETLNALIDYLHGARVKPGYGISVRETPSGTIVELAKKEAPTINNTTGGTGATQDISARVTGGTATVSLSGSASSVELVGGSNVNITGNTNGQIEIGASANTGMPDYSAIPTFVSVDSANPYINTFQYSIWLIGQAGAGTSTDMSGTARLVIDTTRSVSLFNLSAYPNQAAFYGISHGFCIPVPAGYPIGITASGNVGVQMYIYPAIV